MPFYTQKPYKVEVVEVTSENINNVFTWVSSSDAINAHSLTADSFSFNYNNSQQQNVVIGSLIMRRADKAFTVANPTNLNIMWVQVPEGDVAAMPTQNQLVSNTFETWTRFSELVF